MRCYCWFWLGSCDWCGSSCVLKVKIRNSTISALFRFRKNVRLLSIRRIVCTRFANCIMRSMFLLYKDNLYHFGTRSGIRGIRRGVSLCTARLSAAGDLPGVRPLATGRLPPATCHLLYLPLRQVACPPTHTRAACHAQDEHGIFRGSICGFRHRVHGFCRFIRCRLHSVDREFKLRRGQRRSAEG